MILKRLFDLSVAIFCLIVFGWLIIICFILSTIIHRSNGFYLQERMGKNAKPFKIYKLKSMKKIAGYDSATTLEKDPRVTAFGNFIRKTKIDELPQIINVLFGQMSIVGPRPTVRSDYERMSEAQKKRFEVSPGITGLAQINGNTSLQWPDRILLDIEYIETQSFILDWKILFKTIAMVFTNNAETHPASEDEWKAI